MEEVEDEAPSILLPCSICCRTFKVESLERHKKICEKNSVKRRKTFDSSKQRIQGTELAEFLPSVLPNKAPEKLPATTKNANTDWKQKHLEFVKAVKSARNADTKVKKVDNSPKTTPRRSSNYEKCPHCDRCFGPKAYDGHTKWCSEQKARLHKPPVNHEAKERLEARTKYRAPLLAKSRRSLTREKYAPSGRKSSDSIGSPRTERSLSTSSNDSNATIIVQPIVRSPLAVRRSGVVNTSNASNLSQNRLRQSQRRRLSSPEKKISPSSKNVKQSSPVPPSKDCSSISNKSDVLNHPTVADDNDESKPWYSKVTDVHKDKRYSHEEERKARSTSIETYDPYISAERQMMELVSHSKDKNQTQMELVSHSKDKNQTQILSDQIIRPTPIPAIMPHTSLSTSPTSAFTKYTNASPELKKPETPDVRVESPPNIVDLDNIVISGHSSFITPLSQYDKCNNNAGSHNSLDDISLCSSPSFLNDNFEKSQRRNTSSRYRAKLEQAALSLQRSVSLFHPPEKGNSDEDLSLLILESENNILCSPHPKCVSVVHPKTSEEKKTVKLRSQDKKLSTRKTDKMSQSEDELSSPDSAMNNRRSYGSKIGADSAYSSLNRRSPHSEIPQGLESQIIELTEGETECCCASSSGSESSLPQLCSVQTVNQEQKSPQPLTVPSPLNARSPVRMPKFCHECGSKYPISVAKFCCECGVRRLVL